MIQLLLWSYGIDPFSDDLEEDDINISFQVDDSRIDVSGKIKEV